MSNYWDHFVEMRNSFLSNKYATICEDGIDVILINYEFAVMHSIGLTMATQPLGCKNFKKYSWGQIFKNRYLVKILEENFTNQIAWFFEYNKIVTLTPFSENPKFVFPLDNFSLQNKLLII